MLNCYSILQTHEFMIVVLITYTPAHIQYTVYNTLKLQFNILMGIAQCPYYTSIYYSDYIINCMAARISK